jgi:predicted nucleic acid-binding protein
VINLDTNTAIAFVSEGSPVRHQLRAFVDNQQLVMVQTAYDEFLRIIQASGGSAEQERAERFMKRVTVVPDNPSPAAQMLKPTRRIGENDIIILGTGDQMGIVTITADAKAVRAASAQGVDFNVYLHSPYSLTGS